MWLIAHRNESSFVKLEVGSPSTCTQLKHNHQQFHHKRDAAAECTDAWRLKFKSSCYLISTQRIHVAKQNVLAISPHVPLKLIYCYGHLIGISTSSPDIAYFLFKQTHSKITMIL